jgi:hypothetical protein
MNHWGRWIAAICFAGAIAVTGLMACILGEIRRLTTGESDD